LSKDCYPGGKNAAGVYHTIINQMPPHRIYIEPFLGSGAILRNKRPADGMSYGIEPDQEVFTSWQQFEAPGFHTPELQPKTQSDLATLVFKRTPNGKSVSLRIASGTFDDWRFRSGVHWDHDETLIYMDPPYLKEAIASTRPIYKHDYSDWFSHEELLRFALSVQRARVMISGYDHPLYAERLAGWRKITYTGMTRGGARQECLWMNYAEPVELHDYTYLGDGYREREDIRRQQRRWIRKLQAMPVQQRFALVAVLEAALPRDHATAALPVPAVTGEDTGTIAQPVTSTTGNNAETAVNKFAGPVAGSSAKTAATGDTGEARGVTNSGGNEKRIEPAKNLNGRKPLKGERAMEWLASKYFSDWEIEEALTSSNPVKTLRARAVDDRRGYGGPDGGWFTEAGGTITFTFEKTGYTTDLRTLAKKVLDDHAAGAPPEAELNWPPRARTAKVAGARSRKQLEAAA
jgi:DNA adenine methylase